MYQQRRNVKWQKEQQIHNKDNQTHPQIDGKVKTQNQADTPKHTDGQKSLRTWHPDSLIVWQQDQENQRKVK